MALGFNLSHLVPGPALIFNKNIIPLLEKPPVSDEASYKTAHIYREYILVDLRLFSCEKSIIIQRDNTDGLLLGEGTFWLSFHYCSQK